MSHLRHKQKKLLATTQNENLMPKASNWKFALFVRHDYEGPSYVPVKKKSPKCDRNWYWTGVKDGQKKTSHCIYLKNRKSDRDQISMVI